MTEEQKSGIEMNLWRVATHAPLDSLRLFLSYVAPQGQEGTFRFYKVKDGTAEIALFNALEDAMREDNADVFELTWDTLIRPPQSVLNSDTEARARLRMATPRTHCRRGCRSTGNDQTDAREVQGEPLSHLNQISHHPTPSCYSATAVELVRYLL